jgi:hypothetical protein
MKVVKESHLDHGVPDNIISWVLEKHADVSEFIKTTVTICPGLGEADNALYGPICGDQPIPEDQVTYSRRSSGRKWESRLIDKPLRKSNKITLIAGPVEGQDDIVVYTIHGGPIAAEEIGDLQAKLKNSESPSEKILLRERLDESKMFWKKHALSTALLT